MGKLISLGIESTAHTFGVGIVCADGSILANEKSAHIPKKGAGIVPREAAEHHKEVATEILIKSLEKSKLSLKDVSLVSVATGPGLPPCLNTGLALGRFIALKHKLPLVPVNHCIAHIEIGKLTTGADDPIILYFSGGNTQIIAFTEGRYRIFGETVDIPVGNALDIFSRGLGLPTPGGPEIEALAEGGRYVELPYVVKGMDLSFAGITTYAIKKFKAGVSKKDICYSFQENCFAMLVEVAERALAHTGKDEVLVVGGVAANKRLQEMVGVMCKERGSRMYVVPKDYSGDCGASIAWTGLLAQKGAEQMNPRNVMINKNWRTDEVEITWL